MDKNTDQDSAFLTCQFCVTVLVFMIYLPLLVWILAKYLPESRRLQEREFHMMMVVLNCLCCLFEIGTVIAELFT